jgi:hypothetical protein
VIFDLPMVFLQFVDVCVRLERRIPGGLRGTVLITTDGKLFLASARFPALEKGGHGVYLLWGRLFVFSPSNQVLLLGMKYSRSGVKLPAIAAFQ